LGEHLLRQTWNQFLELAEAFSSVLKIEQNHGFPFPPDDVSRQFDRTIKFFHAKASIPVPGHKKVPTSNKDTLA
jgi:hypothetical protein